MRNVSLGSVDDLGSERRDDGCWGVVMRSVFLRLLCRMLMAYMRMLRMLVGSMAMFEMSVWPTVRMLTFLVPTSGNRKTIDRIDAWRISLTTVRQEVCNYGLAQKEGSERDLEMHVVSEESLRCANKVTLG